MYKIAILGCENSHANTFLNFVIKDKIYTDVEVVGVYSDNLEAANKLNEVYGVYVAKSYDEFVGKVDGIMIVARHGDNHYKYAKPYIESGIPMFIDKPITISETDALELKEELIKSGTKVCGGSVCRYNVSYSNAKQIDIGYSTYRFKHESWTDEIYNGTVTDVGLNLTVSSSAYIAKNSAFKVGDQIISKVPASGNVTPVFTVKNTGDACWVDVITVVYDKDGNMVDYKCGQKTVETSEGTEISGLTVDASKAAGGGRIEAFVVDKADRMRPLGIAVLGPQADIGTSELTDVKYSTYANTITVEGRKNANEKLVLTVKDLSGNVLAVTGFKAGSDGKFKNTVAINPALYTAGTAVKVILSNVDDAEDDTIDMSSKWKPMIDELNGEETIDASFFTTYADCFSYIDNQGATQTALDVTALTDVAFLIDTFRKAKAFEGMTSKGIIEKLIEINGKVEDGSVADFVADMNAASSADEVKELLTSEETKAFIAFDFTGVSNIVAIATNMATNRNTIQRG